MTLYEKCVNSLTETIRLDVEESLRSGDNNWSKEMIELVLVDTDISNPVFLLSPTHPLFFLHFGLENGGKIEQFLKKVFNREEAHIDIHDFANDKNLDFIDEYLRYAINHQSMYPNECYVSLPLEKLVKIHNLKCRTETNITESTNWFIKELVDFKPEDILAECKINVNFLSEKSVAFLKEYRLRKSVK